MNSGKPAVHSRIRPQAVLRKFAAFQLLHRKCFQCVANAHNCTPPAFTSALQALFLQRRERLFSSAASALSAAPQAPFQQRRTRSFCGASFEYVSGDRVRSSATDAADSKGTVASHSNSGIPSNHGHHGLCELECNMVRTESKRGPGDATE